MLGGAKDTGVDVAKSAFEELFCVCAVAFMPPWKTTATMSNRMILIWNFILSSLLVIWKWYVFYCCYPWLAEFANPIRAFPLSRAAEDVIVVVVVMMLETTRTVMALDGG